MTAEIRTSRPWRLRVSVIAAVVVGIACAAPTAYAAWTAQATATGSVTAGRVTATLSGDLASVLTNAQMTTTRSVTLTNTTTGTSTQPAQTSMKLSMASGDTTLATSTTLVVWPTAAAAQCTPAAAVGPGSIRSTWAAGTTMTSSVGRGQSTTYCVRTTAGAGAGGSGGARSLVASASATVSVGSFSATPPAVSGTLSTSGIHPFSLILDSWNMSRVVGQQSCMDVTGGQNARPGAAVGIYPCHSQLTSTYWNQQFSMFNVGGQYAVLTARAPAGMVLQATASGVVIAARDVDAVAQRWVPQSPTYNTWQYVNLSTGTCITAPASAGPLTMSPCTGSPSQTFNLFDAGPMAAQDPDSDATDPVGTAVADAGEAPALGSPSTPGAGASASDLRHDSAGAAEPAGSAPSPSTPVYDGAGEDRAGVDELGEDEVGDDRAVPDTVDDDDTPADDTATAQHGTLTSRDEPELLKDVTDD